ncbi:MAG: DUF5702 domain-containing protein [Lachnospiraceae bacterium]|nr:DUF5702 domain-containing protein [Lachnospiraceae bacterium]
MKEKGAVTVFLSFTFLLIMSLVLTLLEGARRSAAATVADMQLTTCVESIMGEYYRPLYENYSLFAIDAGFGGKTADIREMENVMTGYAGESSFGLRVADCEISSTRPLLTKDGSVFMKQAIEYEKYCAAVDTISAVLERFGVLSKEGEVYKVFERQMEIEEELARIDQNTLLLMEKIDGAVCNGATVGEIHELFVKSFMTKEINPINAGINNPDIWTLLEDKYFNPFAYADNADQLFEMAIPVADERDELKKERNVLLAGLEALNKEISAIYERLSEAESTETEGTEGESTKTKGTDEERPEIKELKAEIARLSEEAGEFGDKISEVTKKIKELNESINDLVMSAGVHTDELMRRVSGCLLESREAVQLIEEDYDVAQKTRPMIDAFSGLLEKSKGILSKETYESMLLSLKKMKRYTGMDGSAPDFASMHETLKTDVSVLSGIESEAFLSGEIANAVLREVSGSDIRNWQVRIDSVRKKISDFSYDKLVFDYSEIKPDRMLCELSDGVQRLWAKGFLGLLTDGRDISEKRLKVRNRPSDYLDDEAEGSIDVQKLLEEELKKESGAESFLGSDITRAMSGSGGVLEKDKSDIWDKLLLILYIREHFGDNIDRVTSAKSALAYEQEYILYGNRSDPENLADAASKIMLVRMMTSAAYVLTASAIHTRAAKIASALVGFAGLPFLTAIVKYMIMFAWSVEQAIVETAAIISGKKVSVLTTESSYCIESFDISAITPDGIKEKVKLFKESSVYLGYGDYLFLFMLSRPVEELSLRALDMIEENMRWAYDDNFLISNCITGFDTSMKFTCPSRYIGIFDGLFSDIKTPEGYGFIRSDSVDY